MDIVLPRDQCERGLYLLDIDPVIVDRDHDDDHFVWKNIPDWNEHRDQVQCTVIIFRKGM